MYISEQKEVNVLECGRAFHEILLVPVLMYVSENMGGGGEI